MSNYTSLLKLVACPSRTESCRIIPPFFYLSLQTSSPCSRITAICFASPAHYFYGATTSTAALVTQLPLNDAAHYLHCYLQNGQASLYGQTDLGIQSFPFSEMALIKYAHEFENAISVCPRC